MNAVNKIIYIYSLVSLDRVNLIKVLSCENRRHPLLLSEVLRLIDINQVCHILLKFDDELYLQNGKLWYILIKV